DRYDGAVRVVPAVARWTGAGIRIRRVVVCHELITDERRALSDRMLAAVAIDRMILLAGNHAASLDERPVHRLGGSRLEAEHHPPVEHVVRHRKDARAR